MPHLNTRIAADTPAAAITALRELANIIERRQTHTGQAGVNAGSESWSAVWKFDGLEQPTRMARDVNAVANKADAATSGLALARTQVGPVLSEK